MPIRKISKVWYIEINRYLNGKRFFKRASTNKAVAQKIHDELVARRDLARFGIAPDNYPLKELKEKFLNEIQPRLKPKCFHDHKLLLDKAAEYIGNVPLVEIRSRLNEYLIKRKDDGLSPRTLNRTLGLCKRMLSYGVQATLVPFNPVADVPRFAERRNHRRSLTREEIDLLLERSGQWRPVWLCFLTTGMRRSELVNLTWNDVDLKARKIYIRTSKTDAGVRTAYITDGLLGELNKLQQHNGGYVFTTQQGTSIRNGIYRRFIRCVRTAGIRQDGLNIHSLRHTFATLLASTNTHPVHMQRLLGHSSAVTSLDVYTKTYDKDLKDAVNRLGL
ncbi:MAG: tyrosine-type recombinase/integrase [Planctomycetota bacterium]|jgi:integrase/recombinase XerD